MDDEKKTHIYKINKKIYIYKYIYVIEVRSLYIYVCIMYIYIYIYIYIYVYIYMPLRSLMKRSLKQIVNFERISHLVPVFLLLTCNLNIYNLLT